MKLKILGLALLAVAATSALAVTNASGEPSGDFYHHASGTSAKIIAHEGALVPGHQLKFYGLEDGTHKTNGNKPIECDTAEYNGTVSTRSNTVIHLAPKYTNCHTETAATGTVTVNPEGCTYTFYSQGVRKHGTVEVSCPSGQSIKIKHPSCEITVPAQTTASTLTEGISYTNITDNGVPAITAHVTVNTITGHYHAGICVFLGTPHKFQMIGTAIIKGFEDVQNGAQIGITST